MDVPIEALLQPLYEEEKAAYFADLSQDTPEDVSALHKAIIIDSLTNVKNFMASFGLVFKDFFDPNKSRFSLHPIKGGKGGKGEAFPALGGKATGKSGSTNRPKDPSPLLKQGGSVPLSKPTSESLSVPLVLHKPPTKAGGATLPLVVKHPATPKPGVESTVTVEPVPKAESAVLEQPKAKGEAVVVADPPKPKGEAAPATEQPKAKMEPVTQQDLPKVEAKAVAVSDQPKPEGQSKPLLSFAGIKGRLGLGPSKPARPPPLSQDDSTQLEEDEEADVQAAIQESLKTPTSPQVQSGAQSSTSKPMLDLDQRESDLMTQLDKLMTETLRLETMANPSIRDKSRMRSIEGVAQGIVKQLEEIEQKRSQSAPPALSSQTSKVQSAMPIAAPPVSRPEVPSAQVKVVSPHKGKPLTIEKPYPGHVEAARSAGSSRW